MNELLLDTHIWIWFVTGDETLPIAIRKAINKAIQHHKACIAAISLWEISMLSSRDRVILGLPCLEWINKSIEINHLQILPLTPEVAIESCALPGSFHGDPADCLIVATARTKGIPLVTRDKKILAYSQHNYLSTIKA